MSLTRRAALSRSLAMAAGASAFLSARGSRAASPTRFVADPFKLGVASGDPSADGFVIWTRLAPNPLESDGGLGGQAVEVKWEVAADPAFRSVVQAGTATAQPERGHSVHVELYGLPSDRPYWYRFEAGGVRSPAGRGATLPSPAASKDRLKLAWASCQHYEQGFFTPYRDMVAWQPDLILHLGDYIYDASWGPQVRRHATQEPRTLAEYRAHHAVYKLDPDLQAAHAAAPWAFIWDDHEVENDYAALIAENPAENDAFPARRAAAYQAYFEHLPLSRRSLLTVGGEMRLYQQLLWGDLAQLVMLDTRQYRAPRACVTPERYRSGVVDCAELNEPGRTILGADQEFWFNTTLNRNPARWNVIVQPTLFSDLEQKTPAGTSGAYNDGWDGYPAARQKILDAVARRGVQDVVVIGGDMHAFIAADVKADFRKPDSAVVASEFVTTSITSHSYNYDRYQRMMADPANAHLKYYDDRKRGWAAAEITRERWNVDFRQADTVWTRTPQFSTQKRFVVEHGRAGVVAA